VSQKTGNGKRETGNGKRETGNGKKFDLMNSKLVTPAQAGAYPSSRWVPAYAGMTITRLCAP